MFNSLLNAISVDALILDIFIILGVVIAGALVVYFLWEAVSSIVNKNKQEAPKQESVKADENVEVMNYQLDAQPVEEKTEETVLDEEKVEEVNEVKAEEEKSEAQAELDEQERINAERRAYLEERRQELIRRMQAEMEEDEDNEEESAEDEESAEEEPVEEKVEEPVDNLEEERQALAAEKARYEAMVKELEKAKQELAEHKTEPAAPAVYTTVVRKGALTLDELKAKLAEAEENLKVNDKEFKQCKKEYMPLRRVWTTHERDEKKLRRREALVAKQKVLLYGVNNMADIDEEKAKKLAEDLDLLDGLKLSVQHCEEVMKESAERYPYLERMYNVLKDRNDQLKSDIEYYQSEIARLEAETNE